MRSNLNGMISWIARFSTSKFSCWSNFFDACDEFLASVERKGARYVPLFTTPTETLNGEFFTQLKNLESGSLADASTEAVSPP